MAVLTPPSLTRGSREEKRKYKQINESRINTSLEATWNGRETLPSINLPTANHFRIG
jgi:hypothetical protein